jgi:hypothetical protein
VLDPRQKVCWEFYTNIKDKETFGNAYQSALKAGYEESFAAVITTRDWFKEKVRRMNLLGKAEKVLDRTLDYEPIDDEGKIKTDLVRIQTDVAKFVAKTQGKDEGYSERTELTGKDGKELPVPIININDVPKDQINQQDNILKEENQGDPRGNEC